MIFKPLSKIQYQKKVHAWSAITSMLHAHVSLSTVWTDQAKHSHLQTSTKSHWRLVTIEKAVKNDHQIQERDSWQLKALAWTQAIQYRVLIILLKMHKAVVNKMKI